MNPPEEHTDAKPRKLRLPRVPKNEPLGPEPHRPFVIRLISSPFNMMLAMVALWPFVFLIKAVHPELGAYLLAGMVFLMYGLMLYYLAYAAFAAFSVWFKTQKQLSEILATLFFGAAVTTILQSIHQGNRDRIVSDFLTAFAWAGMGSTWAWDRMRLLGETAQRPRLVLLVRGWVAVPGIAGAMFVLFATIMWLVNRSHFSAEEMQVWMVWYGCSVCATLLAWPAVAVERKLRERRRAGTPRCETPDSR